MRRRGAARGGFSVWKPQPAIKDDPPSSLRFQVQNLSGGELQRVALTLCLGKPADVYLIDEPSAYLDSEQRLMAARVIKRCWSFSSLPSQRCSAVQLGQHPYFCCFRYILHAKKTAFVVEHDFIMATYLADRVIVFDGIPSRSTAANT